MITDVFYMSKAEENTKYSNCLRKGRQVGAVIVKDDKILGKGWNGAPIQMPPCTRCLRESHNIPSGQNLDHCMAFHAEQEAIYNGITNNPTLEGSTIYTTLYPCATCAKAIARAGIKRVVYRDSYNSSLTERIFREANIEVVRI